MNQNILNGFSFILPTRIEYGLGSVIKLPCILKEFNSKRPLIVTDKGIIKCGLFDKVKKVLEGNVKEFSVFDEIEANPKDYNVEMVAKAAKGFGADGIVAFGGGSPIDAAKAALPIISYGGSILTYIGKDKVPGPVLPFITIPTSAGTGSEVTFSAVITLSSENFKITTKSVHMAPKAAILDPELTISLPPAVTAASGVDALTHAIEAYSATVSGPISDALALYAIELISQNIREAFSNGSNIEARAAMLIGSLLGGLAFSHSDVASMHCMAEAMGGIYDAPHGACNSILLPYVMAYSMDYAIPKYARIARAMGAKEEDDKKAAGLAVDMVRQLVSDVKLPKMREIGLKEEDLEVLSEMSERNLSSPSNPRHMGKKEYLELFKIVLNG